MKKHLLTLVIVMFAGMFASAQSISVIDAETSEEIQNGAVIELTHYNEIMGEIHKDYNIFNTSSNSLRITCDREELSVVEETMNYFCWGNCFDPTVNSGTNIVDGGMSDIFSVHYMPLDMEGTTTVRYSFYDEANPNAKFVITFNFIYPYNDVNEYANSVTFSNAYPNPASSVVSFDYDFQSEVGNAVVVIYDMTGREVKSQEISGVSGKANVDVAGLSAGVYFYSLVIDGAIIKSNKITVK